MIHSIKDSAVLNNGVKMPWLGLGVWQGKPEDGEHVESAVKSAISVGYRSIDTAAGYENERGVGNAVRDCGVAREELFVTTKIRNEDQGYESTLRAFEESYDKLNVGVIDLMLVHWPIKGKYKDTWRALEKFYAEGRVRAIGVSNFQIHHLDDLLADAKVVPTVNQVEYHPRLSQKELHAYCKKQGIQLEAWSPLMHARQLDNPILLELASKHRKTAAQILLRWDLQNEVVTIPKSVRPERIAENAAIFDFRLSDEDMHKIDALNENQRIGPDPDTF